MLNQLINNTNNRFRDYTQTREQHLALPTHDWMVCKSWHCFHGNKLNWDPEKLAKYERSQVWYMQLGRILGIVY